MKLSKKAAFIINTLNTGGFEAYVVGGSVRDQLMGNDPKDWDIATGAEPEQIKQLFDNCIETGIRHGTVTVLLDKERFEVTTFRVDGSYSDSRHPDSIVYTNSIEQDLSRRDFTVNAIAWHPEKGFIDPFGGMSDIRESMIRAVGEPDKRFQEDALRMLRAVRFSAQLDFVADSTVLESLKRNSRLINKISAERIRDELTKTITSKALDKFTLLRDTGLLKQLIPEFDMCYTTEQNNPYHVYNVALHTLKAMKEIENTPHLRWTMLLHDIGKPSCKTTDEKGIDHFYEHQAASKAIAEKLLRKFKFDLNSMNKILKLIEYHDININLSHVSVRRTLRKAGSDIFPDLIKVQKADKLAQNPAKLGDRIKNLNRIKEIYKDIVRHQQCISLDRLAVNGHDLISSGTAQGPDLGKLLNKLLDLVIENPELNSKERLLELASTLKL